MQYSVVIATYNRQKQLLLTLTALEQQNFPQDLYEVIVVDDGSTDKTKAMIKNFNPAYKLSYFSTGKRKGQASARNLGYQQAQGAYIIFCDADFLVKPNFIQIIDQYYQENKQAIISATPNCFRNVYTHFYPEFNEWEINQARKVIQSAGLWDDSYLQSKQIISIITQDDIRQNFAKVEQVLNSQEDLTKRNKKQLSKLDVAPWLLFITRCVSLPKVYLEKVGGFDERLARGEDWELGFRLYKQGLPFMSIEQTIGYHQAHPNLYRLPTKDYLPFSKVLLDKYGFHDPEILLLVNWHSSDQLWSEIAVYKNSLRVIKKMKKKSPEDQDALSSLLQACKIASMNWLRER